MSSVHQFAVSSVPEPRAAVEFSVIIPTFNRSDVVVASVQALERLRATGSFEVIVVVDGSRDDSSSRLRSLSVSFPLRVLEQPNSGAAVARNRGAGVAQGEILLFLDDDMEADPDLLVEHRRSHEAGADAVVGHLPLHPESPDGLLSRGVGLWAQRRLERLIQPGAELALEDLLTGQLSVARATFEALGGFDAVFTRDGAFGNEDIDFGYRLLRSGYRVVFNPRAVSWQRYVISPEAHLRQWRDAGNADVTLAHKYPERAEEIFGQNEANSAINRFVWRPLVEMPRAGPLVDRGIRAAALALANRGRTGLLARRLFKTARFLHYWGGVREAGGMPLHDAPRVLAYHSISELEPESPLAPYAVPPNLFEKQIDTLLAAGFWFMDAEALLEHLAGSRDLATRAILLTFDDCYSDLLHSALPVIRARRIPAVAFAVSGQVGGTNVWDRGIGAPELRLLDADDLRTVASAGVEIGAHSRTHRVLPRLSRAELKEEVGGCVTDIEALGLPRPRLFAYPFGEHSRRVERAAKGAGLSAAFVLSTNPLRPGMNPLRIPRIEILASHVGPRFARAVAAAGRGRTRLASLAIERDLEQAWDGVR